MHSALSTEIAPFAEYGFFCCTFSVVRNDAVTGDACMSFIASLRTIVNTACPRDDGDDLAES
jgi:hypothetical protein